MLDSGSRTTSVSEKLGKSHFTGERLVYSIPESHSVIVADGGKVVVTQQTQRLQVSVHNLWEPVVIGVAFAVISITDDVLVLGENPAVIAERRRDAGAPDLNTRDGDECLCGSTEEGRGWQEC